LRGKPVAVGGGIEKGSVVAAASYEAKAFGIKSGMATWDAKKLCPNLIIIIGDMTKYAYTSKIIFKMLRDYTDLVEIFSIDEAFMDITETMERWGGESELARDIKKRIKGKFGLTCSIGIGPNKLMAKFAGELQKPDGLVILRPDDIPEKIKDVAVKELCGVGRKIEKYLAELGVKTFGDLNKYPREKLVKRFGIAYGEQLWQMGQGKGSDNVKPYYYEVPAKSMGHSYTLPKAAYDLVEVKSYLLRLSEQVGRRLRSENYKGNIVHVSLSSADFKYWGKQKKIEDYINDGYRIYKTGEKLIDDHMRNVGTGLACLPARQVTVRFVGVSLSGLIQNKDQISIFESDEKGKMALKSMDEINNRFGEFTIERAAIMETVLRGKTGMVSSRNYKTQ